LFTIRNQEEGATTILTWQSPQSQDVFTLERAGSDGNYAALSEQSPYKGSFTDENPLSGWNHYRLLNNRNEVIAATETFVKGKSELTIFPNPAQNRMTLSLPNCKDLTSGKLLVYNTMRVCVLQVDADFDDAQSANIDLSSLVPGLYTAVLQTNGATITKQFMVSK
jgi:hypothetical protein